MSIGVTVGMESDLLEPVRRMEVAERSLSTLVRMMEVWEFLEEKARILLWRLKLSEVDEPLTRWDFLCSQELVCT